RGEMRPRQKSLEKCVKRILRSRVDSTLSGQSWHRRARRPLSPGTRFVPSAEAERDAVACGSCRSCGRKDRAHKLLGKRQSAFSTARTGRHHLCCSSVQHIRCSGGAPRFTNSVWTELTSLQLADLCPLARDSCQRRTTGARTARVGHSTTTPANEQPRKSR